jgi:hypothetical protein
VIDISWRFHSTELEALRGLGKEDDDDIDLSLHLKHRNVTRPFPSPSPSPIGYNRLQATVTTTHGNVKSLGVIF